MSCQPEKIAGPRITSESTWAMRRFHRWHRDKLNAFPIAVRGVYYEIWFYCHSDGYIHLGDREPVSFLAEKMGLSADDEQLLRDHFEALQSAGLLGLSERRSRYIYLDGFDVINPYSEASGAWVYFIESVGTGTVKIGFSTNPSKRIHGLHQPGERLVCLNTMPGGRKEEAALHKRFAHLRAKDRPGREWFRLTDELRAFILALPTGQECPP